MRCDARLEGGERGSEQDERFVAGQLKEILGVVVKNMARKEGRIWADVTQTKHPPLLLKCNPSSTRDRQLVGMYVKLTESRGLVA